MSYFITRLQCIQEQSQQNYLPGLELFYGHQPLSDGFYLLRKVIRLICSEFYLYFSVVDFPYGKCKKINPLIKIIIFFQSISKKAALSFGISHPDRSSPSSSSVSNSRPSPLSKKKTLFSASALFCTIEKKRQNLSVSFVLNPNDEKELFICCFVCYHLSHKTNSYQYQCSVKGTVQQRYEIFYRIR